VEGKGIKNMFYPGGGRPKGAINIATRELKQELQLFFSGGEYRDSVKKRIIAGTAPTIELYFLQLLYGKPREHVELNVTTTQEDLSSLSTTELALRAESLLTQLREATELENVLPAEYRVDPATQGATQPEETSIRPGPSSPATSSQEANTPLSSPHATAAHRALVDVKHIAQMRDAAILAEVAKRAALRNETTCEPRSERSDEA
jgi:hypothetical protein